MGIEMNFNPDIPPQLQGVNAQRYIHKFSVLCEHCKNAQTNIQCLKNISKEFEKEYVRFVWDFILNNNVKLFTKKELMQKLKINHISDGVLQDKALSILIMLGYIRKEEQVWVNDKKEEKTRYIYIKNAERKLPLCYDTQKDKHIPYDFFSKGIRKEYFRNKKRVEDDKDVGE
jgi:hypothetical protein